MNQNEAKSKIKALIEKYEVIKDSGKIKSYNEEMTKKDFILPLFEALGWDITNFNEVTAEEKVSRGRVDYAFKLNEVSKFFIEAKAMKVDLDERKWAEQAINYSWHKGVTWAVLTDFEGIKVFNAEVKTTNYYQSTLFEMKYHNYLNQFEDLWLLSKESFEQKLIDKEAERRYKKVKKVPVDKQLLYDFTRFRELLSKDILKHNQNREISQELLDESVQRILDRLIFIRKCEDSEIESKDLSAALNEWNDNNRINLYSNIISLFREYDEKYNSKLFQEHISESFIISSDVIHKISKGMYHTIDKTIFYNFADLDADVLGNMYEQYLGHLLKSTKSRAKLESGSTKRKDQGIYYTPTYIVKFIVENTIGNLLKDKKNKLENIKVLDPACGSGSFLIKAFDYLVSKYKTKDKNFEQMKLDDFGSFSKKLEILKNNIYGVDLDEKAVEIAQLNLLLKVAEKRHRLPTMKDNIKTGNSLLEELEISNKAFNWNEEFNKILVEGGFDVVVGNPPYFNVSKDHELKNASGYNELSSGVLNSAALFVRKAIVLLKDNGYFGFIIPKSFIYVDSWDKTRKLFFETCDVKYVVDTGKAFSDVLLEQVIIIGKKTSRNNSRNKVNLIGNFGLDNESVNVVSQSELEKKKVFIFDKALQEIYNLIQEKTILLKEISNNFRGIGAQKHRGTSGHTILGGKHFDRYYIRKCPDKISNQDLELYKPKADKLTSRRIIAQNIVAHIRNHIKLTATMYDSYVLDTVNNIEITDDNYLPEYILGLLNSKIINFYAYNFIFFNAIRTMHFDGNYSGKIPIKIVDLKTQQKVKVIVEELLQLTNKLNLNNDKSDFYNSLEDKKDKLENELNEVIFGIYRLTKEQKEFVNKTFE